MPASTRLNISNLITLISVTILVGTEVFGVALAAGWALAGIFELGTHVSYALMAAFSALALYGMIAFLRRASRMEPIRTP